MGKLEEGLRGCVRLEISGPEPEKLLNACLAEELPLLRPQSVDPWTLRLGCYERDLPRLEALAAKTGCESRILSRRGGSRTRKLLRRRSPLLLAGALLLTLLFVSSLFVWEIRPVGAASIPRGELLRELEDCGLGIGCFRPALDADALRDRMLLREPRLLWLAVRLRGSTAEVLLLERREKPESDGKNAPADLVASRPGIVRRVSALEGLTLVQPGAAVTGGEPLVAGRMENLSSEPRLVRAQGEVWADTWYELTALCPAGQGKSGASGRSRLRFALKIGKSRVNFYQNAGKTIDGCDKIVHEYILGVDGLFSLPLRLVCEELRPYGAEDPAQGRAEAAGQRLLAALAERIEGEILSSSLYASDRGGLTIVTLRAHCLENIAEQADIIP